MVNTTTYRFLWLFGECVCRDMFLVKVREYTYTTTKHARTLRVLYHGGGGKTWKNVRKWRVEIGGGRIRIWRGRCRGWGKVLCWFRRREFTDVL